MSLPQRWIAPVTLGVLLGILGIDALGACLDFVAAIRYPYELDYGEGVVWLQTTLIPGPRMYAAPQGLPFIVFHYPPLYYFLTRAASWFMPDLLAAGRLVSAIAAMAIVPLVASLVLLAAPSPAGRRRMHVAVAVAAGLLALGLHAVRSSGLLMRVDMVAVALGLAGVLVAAWADGAVRGTACALLLCLAAVYCKQTQLPAGIAVFVVTLLRRPRTAIAAAAVPLAIGLAALGLLEWLTGGGFLQNIIAANVNRFGWQYALLVLPFERTSLPSMAVMLLAAWSILRGLMEPGRSLAQRLADRTSAARAMLLLHFALAVLMLPALFKSGSSFNYLLDCFCVGCVLIGVWLCDLTGTGRQFALTAAVLMVAALFLPFRQLLDRVPQAELAAQDALVQRIADADKPVASEDVALLMRAGKPVIFEPAIATELASVGRWDEAPLLAMIARGDFAFMITIGSSPNGPSRRTPAVEAAMQRAYPRLEQADPLHWLHLPAG